jgi:hypothetical protein
VLDDDDELVLAVGSVRHPASDAASVSAYRARLNMHVR